MARCSKLFFFTSQLVIYKRKCQSNKEKCVATCLKYLRFQTIWEKGKVICLKYAGYPNHRLWLNANSTHESDISSPISHKKIQDWLIKEPETFSLIESPLSLSASSVFYSRGTQKRRAESWLNPKGVLSGYRSLKRYVRRTVFLYSRLFCCVGKEMDLETGQHGADW